MNQEIAEENDFFDRHTTEPFAFKCDKCERAFKSKPALTMHKVRKHGKGWSTGGNFRNRKPKVLKHLAIGSRERELAMKRLYNRRMRERFYAKGLDSRGQAKTQGLDTGEAAPRIRSEVDTGAAQEIQKDLCNKRFERMAKASRLPIVYPDPRTENEKINAAIRNTWPEEANAEINIPTLKFCPNCGEHLEGWRKS